MVELNKIPHINEISNHGAFAGAGQKRPPPSVSGIISRTKSFLRWRRPSAAQD